MTAALELTPGHLVAIYLDGFCTGAATLAINAGQTSEYADGIADAMASAIRNDRTAIDEVLKEIKTRLTNPDVEGGPGREFIVNASEESN